MSTLPKLQNSGFMDMKQSLRVPLLAIVFTILLVGSENTASVSSAAVEFVSLGCQTETGSQFRSIESLSRRELIDDVIEYTAIVRVGPGDHDKIGVHRVLRERAPFVPNGNGRAVFLVHGSGWGFDPTFAAGVEGIVSPADTLAVNMRTREWTSGVWITGGLWFQQTPKMFPLCAPGIWALKSMTYKLH
jgi:hypothetical protein